MKIGIISQFSLKNVNYGNKLQAFALNHYLRTKMINDEIVSLFFSDYGRNLLTKKQTPLSKLIKKMKRVVLKFKGEGIQTPNVSTRLERINQFAFNNIKTLQTPLSWDDLNKNDFDMIIVGSDIVWGQFEGRINRKFFLDFDGQKSFKKISYAASFGRDWIPEENKYALKNFLSKFSAISVRESSSVDLLAGIGVNNAEYVLDPTLLIEEDEWRSHEKKPKNVDGEYIFAFFLGREKSVRNIAINLSKKLGLAIVTIPFASGEYNKYDEKFGSVKIMDCSVEEWLWLVDHAKYVVTDSFHCVVFSTIFRKKFIVLERTYTENINNRMIDYLRNIGQLDKLLRTPDAVSDIDNLSWDYEDISKMLCPLINKSVDFIENKIIESAL